MSTALPSALAYVVKIDDTVELVNLVTRTDLNGKTGKVMSLDLEVGRVAVAIEGSASVRVGLENLRHAETPAVPQVDVANNWMLTRSGFDLRSRSRSSSRSLSPAGREVEGILRSPSYSPSSLPLSRVVHRGARNAIALARVGAKGPILRREPHAARQQQSGRRDGVHHRAMITHVAGPGGTRRTGSATSVPRPSPQAARCIRG